MIRLALPYPPSVWNMYTGWGKTRHQSAEYSKWLIDAGYFFKSPDKPIAVPFVAFISLKRPNKRQDLDNRAKPIFDLLQHYGVIKNDNLCERFEMTWDAGQKEECVVLIQLAEEAMAA